MTALIADSPIPLYVQLANLLREQIARGSLPHDMALPSEPDLMDLYNVSRTTVRQALGVLTDEKIIVKVQGKGSFIREPAVTQDLMSLQTISEVLTSAGLVPEVRVVSVEMDARIPAHIERQLRVEPGEAVVRVERLHLVEGRPIAYAVIYLSGKFEWRFSADDLRQQSIYLWLETKSNILVDRGRQVIRATAASDDVAALLELAPGSPVLNVENTSTTADGTPIDFTEFYFPPDRYSLVVSLHRSHHGVSLTHVAAAVGASNDTSSTNRQ